MKVILIFLLLYPKAIGNNNPSFEVPLSKHVDYIEPIKIEVVTLTIYSPVVGQTDSTPHITASGFEIDLDNPRKHNIIAVSRDLKSKWKFNQKVKIRKAGKYNGVYTVKDVMNKRHKKRIDILVGPDEKPIKLTGVEVTIVE
jgi:3D (Asp-Asp-Asp) domain-containing protein